MARYYALVKMEAFSDRPEILYISKSRNRIDVKLEEIYLKEKELGDVFDYEEGDCLILDSDDAYYIEVVDQEI